MSKNYGPFQSSYSITGEPICFAGVEYFEEGRRLANTYIPDIQPKKEEVMDSILHSIELGKFSLEYKKLNDETSMKRSYIKEEYREVPLSITLSVEEITGDKIRKKLNKPKEA